MQPALSLRLALFAALLKVNLLVIPGKMQLAPSLRLALFAALPKVSLLTIWMPTGTASVTIVRPIFARLIIGAKQPVLLPRPAQSVVLPKARDLRIQMLTRTMLVMFA
jgi:hypothetical protein